MKKCILACLLLTTSALHCDNTLNSYKTETEEIYSMGSAPEEGAFTAISASMLGWGICLALGIGILAAVLHQSVAPAHASPTPDTD